MTSPDRAWANIYCLRAGLFKLEPGRAVVLTCETPPPAGLTLLVSTLPPEIDQLLETAAGSAAPSLDTLPSVRTDFSRSLDDFGAIPIMLSPRWLTDELRPIFRWAGVSGAIAYTLKIEGDGMQVPLDTSQTRVPEIRPSLIPRRVGVFEVTYPAEAPPLKPGITYVITLEAQLPGAQKTQPTNELLFFERLDEADAAAIREAAAGIQRLNLPEGEKHYLLSLLYRQHNLWDKAAEQFEWLAQNNSPTPPLLPLSEMYLHAGLTNLAEAYAQNALEIARANDDATMEADALAILGQTAYVTGANSEAKEYFMQAQAIYVQLKDPLQIEAMQELISVGGAP